MFQLNKRQAVWLSYICDSIKVLWVLPTHNIKKQNKNVPVCAVVRKFCQAGFPINATAIKKGWKWAQDLT